ncbi:hypothetical protein JCM3775_004870 [Rhodotorula graminis]
MATFAKRTFDAAAYSASRPSYPRALLDHVVAFLDRAPPSTTTSTPPTTLVDLGCGPGLSTFDWLSLPSSSSSSSTSTSTTTSPRFERIIGIDPSPGMVAAARTILADRDPTPSADIRFEVARGDKLDGVVDDSTVDLVIAGQAAHWFDAPATYAELARVLKPGGAFAFWGYGEFFFPGKPDLSALIPPYSGGTLGPYWEQPGRSIVEGLLVNFPLPAASPSSPIPSSTASQFDPASLTRTFFLRPDAEQGALPPLLEPLAAPLRPPSTSSSSLSTTWLAPSPSSSAASPAAPSPTGLARLEVHRTLLLTRHWSVAELEGYLRTWSAAHAYDEAHSSEGNGKGDVVSGFVRQLRERGLGELSEGETVEVAWEMGLVMGRKRA